MLEVETPLVFSNLFWIRLPSNVSLLSPGGLDTQRPRDEIAAPYPNLALDDDCTTRHTGSPNERGAPQ